MEKPYGTLQVSKLISKFNFKELKLEFELKCSAWVKNVAPRGQVLLNENSSVRHETPSYKFLFRDIPEGSGTMVLDLSNAESL